MKREEVSLDKPLTIGRLAKLANINVETIRFDQKQGLRELPTPKGAAPLQA